MFSLPLPPRTVSSIGPTKPLEQAKIADYNVTLLGEILMRGKRKESGDFG